LASNLENQLTQLDELLGLLDAGALRGAQETIENEIVELTERLEVTRQALTQAQAQRRRLARARLLLEDRGLEHAPNGGPANHGAAEPDDTEAETAETETVEAETVEQAPMSAPFVAERRSGDDRRASAERRQVTDRRKS
jgi:hypothetical protein